VTTTRIRRLTSAQAALISRRPNDPYEQGFEASCNGDKEEDNPYRLESGFWREWREGHRDGEADWRKLCDGEIAAGRRHPDH